MKKHLAVPLALFMLTGTGYPAGQSLLIDGSGVSGTNQSLLLHLDTISQSGTQTVILAGGKLVFSGSQNILVPLGVTQQPDGNWAINAVVSGGGGGGFTPPISYPASTVIFNGTSSSGTSTIELDSNSNPFLQSITGGAFGFDSNGNPIITGTNGSTQAFPQASGTLYGTGSGTINATVVSNTFTSGSPTALGVGIVGFATDTSQVFIGSATGNVYVGGGTSTTARLTAMGINANAIAFLTTGTFSGSYNVSGTMNFSGTATGNISGGGGGFSGTTANLTVTSGVITGTGGSKIIIGGTVNGAASDLAFGNATSGTTAFDVASANTTTISLQGATSGHQIVLTGSDTNSRISIDGNADYVVGAGVVHQLGQLTSAYVQVNADAGLTYFNKVLTEPAISGVIMVQNSGATVMNGGTMTLSSGNVIFSGPTMSGTLSGTSTLGKFP